MGQMQGGVMRIRTVDSVICAERGQSLDLRKVSLTVDLLLKCDLNQ